MDDSHVTSRKFMRMYGHSQLQLLPFISFCTHRNSRFQRKNFQVQKNTSMVFIATTRINNNATSFLNLNLTYMSTTFIESSTFLNINLAYFASLHVFTKPKAYLKETEAEEVDTHQLCKVCHQVDTHQLSEVCHLFSLCFQVQHLLSLSQATKHFLL